MADALVVTTSLADAVDVTATSETLDATNMLNTDIQKTWRSSSTATQFISVDLGTSQLIDVVHIANHNLSGGAALLITLYDDAYTTAKYSAYVSLRTNTLTYKADTWIPVALAASTVTDENSADVTDEDGNSVTSGTGKERRARYIRITVLDASNSDGYVEIGRLIVGGSVKPGSNSQNLAIGPELSYVERAELIPTRAGGYRSQSKLPQRQLRVEWSWLHDEDNWSISAPSYAQVLEDGHRSDAFVTVYPGDGSDKEIRHEILGRITKSGTLQGHQTTLDSGAVVLWSRLAIEVTEAL